MKFGAADEYTIWTVDSSGNVTDTFGVVAGNSYALELLESSFGQDLNGDGVIGLYAAPGTTLQIEAPTTGMAGAATIGVGATLEIAAIDSASVTFNSSTGMLKLDVPSTFSGEIFNFTGNGSLSGSDQIDLTNINYSSVHDSFTNGVLTVTDGTDTDELNFNGSYVLANFKFASDGNGGTIVYDPPPPVSDGSATSWRQYPTEAGKTLNFTWISSFGAEDGIELSGAGFNAPATLGYLQNSNRTEVTPSSTDASRCGLLGNYMASSLVSPKAGYGEMTVLNDVPWGSQPMLANPHHA